MKTILLAVCGLTPQVITETLYALHQQGQQVDAIRILTTRNGKAACVASLFGSGDGQFYQYLNEYGYDHDSIDFAPRHIEAVADAGGREIDDIASEEENEDFLRACMEETFNLTRDNENRVLFSIAGGRKTMGACLTLAAQCYARPQDRIYHVLVSPEFESNRDFYFPPAESTSITLYDPQRQPYQKETKFARINLIPLPFFSMRRGLTAQMLKQPETPSSLLLSLVREEKHELVIDLAQRKLIWKGVELDMMPARLAFFAFFAKTKKDADCGEDNCRSCSQCYLTAIETIDLQNEVTTLYRKISRRDLQDGGITALDNEYFNSYKSKINKDIENCFGEYEARTLQIFSAGTRPGVRYGIPLVRERIRIIY